ncbi:hypothetical protein ACLOJK_008680 [Asimina triloba]
MADSKTPSDAGSEDFIDAPNHFPLSDIDTVSDSDSGSSVSLPQIVRFDSVDAGEIDSTRPPPSDSSPPNTTLRRRSSVRTARKKISVVDANDSRIADSPASSEVIQVSEATSPPERRNKIVSSLKDQENKAREDAPRPKSTMELNSPKRVENHLRRENSRDVDIPPEGVDDSSSNFLMSLAGFVITAIGFQISLLVSFFSFPFWMLHMFFLLVTDPFQLVRRAKDSLFEKLSRVFGFLFGRVSSVISKQLKGPQSVSRYLAKFGFGFFWSLYVFFVLVGILVTAFVVGGITARYIVEEPIRMEENLNFDYTKANPVACVQVVSCNGICGGLEGKEMVEVGNYIGRHVIPLNHKLQVTLLLALPESVYNRNLGIFQVRVDFLSMNGKVTSTSRHPCMLRFKSMPIRLLETFIKSGPLLAGYSSESQLISLKMTGFAEGTEATSCLRVILEQRAEFKLGAGIPEIYSATLNQGQDNSPRVHELNRNADCIIREFTCRIDLSQLGV